MSRDNRQQLLIWTLWFQTALTVGYSRLGLDASAVTIKKNGRMLLLCCFGTQKQTASSTSSGSRGRTAHRKCFHEPNIGLQNRKLFHRHA